MLHLEKMYENSLKDTLKIVIESWLIQNNQPYDNEIINNIAINTCISLGVSPSYCLSQEIQNLKNEIAELKIKLEAREKTLCKFNEKKDMLKNNKIIYTK